MKPWYNQKWNRDFKGPGIQPIEFVAVSDLIDDHEKELGKSKFYGAMSSKTKWYFERTLEQHKLLDGPVSSEKRVFGSEKEASEYVKDYSKKLGADAAGICYLDQSFIYKGYSCSHKNAISLAMKMDARKLKDVPFSANYESMRIYYELGAVTVNLAAHIRQLGYAARAHHPRGPSGSSLVPHVPIASKAGLGDLGRHGSLISPVLGSWFRLGTVTTDMPLSPDSRLDGGVIDFCKSCRMCVRHCPGEAISQGPMIIANGTLRWVVDTEKCVPYFHDLGSCSICLQVCPWNGKALDAVMRSEWMKDVSRWKSFKREDYQRLPVLDNQPNS